MKNIIICSDGTWQSPESDTATHILRIARGIAPEDAAGNKQVVFYDWGVGSDGCPRLPITCREQRSGRSSNNRQARALSN